MTGLIEISKTSKKIIQFFAELEATLDQQLYHHGDTVSINISIRNNSNKMVKKISAQIMQCIGKYKYSGTI